MTLFRVLSLLLLLPVFTSQPLSAAPPAGAPVTTQRYDNRRSGANLNETVLSPALLKPDGQGRTRFGKLFTRMTDGAIYAQPLYLPQVLIPGKGKRNVVYIATANNSVYAFDADSCLGANAFPLWQRNLGPAIPGSRHDVMATVPLSLLLPTTNFSPLAIGIVRLFEGVRLPVLRSYQEFGAQIGITGTPVIDRTAGLLYVVAAMRADQFGQTVYRQKIYALDIVTGKIRKGPVSIAGAVPGSGDGNINGKAYFDPFVQLQGSALLLDHSTLYVAFGSYDNLPSVGSHNATILSVNRDAFIEHPERLVGCHGWVFAYDARTLTRTAVFCTTPNARTVKPRISDALRLRIANPVDGGINMVGVGPAADDQGDIYVTIGAGTFHRADLISGRDDKAVTESGNTVMRLHADLPRGQFTVADFFTSPALRQTSAQEYGSGIVLCPTETNGVSPSSLALTTATDRLLYLLDSGNAGKFTQGENPAAIPGNPSGGSLPTLWPLSGKPTRIYQETGDSVVHAWTLEQKTLLPLADSLITTSSPVAQIEGEISLSANGASNGLVWAANRAVVAKHPVQRGVLQVFDASPVVSTDGPAHLKRLWTSDDDPTGSDAPGKLPPGGIPMVTGGKVYLPAVSGELSVYAGMKDHRVLPVTAATFVDAAAPLMQYAHEKRLILQGEQGPKIRKAVLLRFVIPDFPPNQPPVSALLTLQLHPQTFKRRLIDSAHPAKVFVTGMDDIGIWQPMQMTWNSAPGIDPVHQTSRSLPIPGASRAILPIQISGEASSSVTFNVSGWIRPRPSLPVTLLLWTDSAEPLIFYRQGNNGPVLALSWQ